MTKLQDLYFTLQGWDGFSVKHDLNEYEGGGYAVGGASKCFEIKADDLSWNHFAYTIVPHLRELTRGKAANLLLGGWVDNDGVAYIELSTIVQNRRQAIDLGVERGELAIYDLWNNEEIRLAKQVSGVTTTKVNVSRKQTQEA
tara:strand:- start:204 stop:632 length:429 start_codon:yes stop_codon:yes gene_type:complete